MLYFNIFQYIYSIINKSKFEPIKKFFGKNVFETKISCLQLRKIFKCLINNYTRNRYRSLGLDKKRLRNGMFSQKIRI